jgi:hypothetical protein
MKRIYLSALLLVSFSSCQQRLYFPERANTPMLSEALEAKVTLSAKPQANHSDSAHGKAGAASFAMDAAFAPVNHFGIIASYRSQNKRRIDEETGILINSYGGVFNGHRWEGGLGYFTGFGRLGRVEAYAGYGNGLLTRSSYYTHERDFSTRYHRFFLQGAAGAGNHIFTAGGGLRVSMHTYYDFTAPDPILRYHVLDLDGPAVDVQQETFVFVEPFINAEVGYRFIRFNMQLGSALQTSGQRIAGNTPFYFSIGCTFHFSPAYLNIGATRKDVRLEGQE